MPTTTDALPDWRRNAADRRARLSKAAAEGIEMEGRAVVAGYMSRAEARTRARQWRDWALEDARRRRELVGDGDRTLERAARRRYRRFLARCWAARANRPQRPARVLRGPTRREAHGRPRQTRAGPDQEGDSSSGEADPDPALRDDRVERLTADLGAASVRVERRLRHHDGQLADAWDLLAAHGERLDALERDGRR
jgi:hypothetical protein